MDYGSAFTEGKAFLAERRFPTEVIGGIRVATMSRQETARLMVDTAVATRNKNLPAMIFSSANGQVLSELSKAQNPAAEALLKPVHVVSADGQPLVFASQLLGGRMLRERCATTDLFHDVAKIAVAENIKFYLLGASPDENRKASDNVRRRYPQLRLVGHRHGYFDSLEDERLAVERINALKPDIVWVALGFPRELEFCHRWCQALTNVGILKTSGGLFNFLSGSRRRAPAWMQTVGLEWAFRIYLEPRRLFVRYATTNLHAIWLLLTKTERPNGRRAVTTSS